MAAINIRGLSDELYKLIKKRADDDNRSINQEIIYLLKKSVMETPEKTDVVWESIDRRRTELRGESYGDSVDLLRKDRKR